MLDKINKTDLFLMMTGLPLEQFFTINQDRTKIVSLYFRLKFEHFH